jgi:hypothetical protein
MGFHKKPFLSAPKKYEGDPLTMNISGDFDAHPLS